MEIKRVLLVEDSPYDAELTRTALAESGLTNEVVWLRDGQQALDYLQHRGAYENRPRDWPVVVLLDLKMPKVDGLEVLERIKKDPVLKALPVVMLTSSHEEADLARSYGLGVNAYVVKPVGFPEFMAAIKELGLFWAVVNQPPPTSSFRGNPS